MKAMFASTCVGATAQAVDGTNFPRVGLCNEAALGLDAVAVEALAAALQRAGAPPRLLDADALCDPAMIDRARLDVLVLPTGPAYPVPAMDMIENFLRNGGGVIFLGGPALTTPFWKQGGQWLERDATLRKLTEAAKETSQGTPLYPLFDFTKGDPGGWQRNSNAQGSPATIGTQKASLDGGQDSLRIHIANLTGWDTFNRSVTFPPGTGRFYIRAKGDARTPQMAVELVEADGSRWIATLNITEKCETYVLDAKEFKFWGDAATSLRGKPGDFLRFNNAKAISIGLALSHTKTEKGEHKIWLQELGGDMAGQEALPPTREIAMDGLGPMFRLYPVTNCASIRVNLKQALVPEATLPTGGAMFSCVPRPQGTGIEKGRKQRFVPLLQARDADGNFLANAAWLFLDKGSAYRGAWACFGFQQKEMYRDKALAGVVADVARRMQDGLFLYEGGSRFYTAFQGESVKLGAEVVNLGRPTNAACTVRIRVIPDGAKEAAYEKEFTIEVSAGKSQAVADTWNPGAAGGRAYAVQVELVRDGQVLDKLVHDFHVWEPKPLAQRRYIQAKDGDLWLGDQKWYAHGVNYMPSSGQAIEDFELFHEYVGARAYDPDLIDEDLRRIARMGMNMVSVFVCHPHHRARNLVDLLMRCEKYGLKVNLSLRHKADPMSFDWDQVREMIESSRLAEHDVLFAYDLAWERHWGFYREGKDILGNAFPVPWKVEWHRWVVERYGSVANAEQDWGVPIGTPFGDSLKHMAAYRRFADDCAGRKHTAAVRLIKGIDPHHLVSFRMCWAGNPVEDPREPYDFRAFRSLDLMEPEAYGGAYAGNPDLGMFTAAYARYAAPGRPVFWAELGVSIWNGSNFSGTPPKTVEQVSFFDRMYGMMLKSYASGSACWFWPGGYRFDEKSDYGVINPDGSWRPVSGVIKKFAEPMTAQRTRPAVDHWITVDRDAEPRGLVGIYARVKDEYWAAVKAGKFPGLRDEGTGKDSTNVPLKAVGNTDYNGNNPPKYLNAEFNHISVKDADGKWVEAQNGSRVQVQAGAPVLCRASAGNTQSAKWIAPANAGGAKGGVYLATAPGSAIQARSPIAADTPCFADAEIPEFVLSPAVDRETRVVLQMTAEGRAWFGEKVEFVLLPK